MNKECKKMKGGSVSWTDLLIDLSLGELAGRPDYTPDDGGSSEHFGAWALEEEEMFEEVDSICKEMESNVR